MNIRTFTFASVILGALSTSPLAYGADSPVNWGGFYAGVSAGENIGDNNDDYAHGVSACTHNNFGYDGGGGICDGNQNYTHNTERVLHSAIGGVHAGYNWDMSNIVIGVESSLSIKDQDDSRSEVISGIGDNLSINSRQNYNGSLKLNIGKPIDRFLLFTNAGISAGEVKTSVIQTAGGYPSRTLEDNDLKIGYTVGAGLKYKITSNWILGGEYSYVDLGKSRVNGESFLSPSTIVYPDTTVQTRNIDNIVQATLSYQF